MVKISAPVLISLLAATATAADLRRAHRDVGRRGNTSKPAPYPTTFTMSTPSPAPYPSSSPKDSSQDTTCTEESTSPSPETQSTYEHSTYKHSTPPAETTEKTKTYPHHSYTTPAESTTPAQSYPSSTTPAESTTPAQSYPHSSPSAETTTPAESTTCTEESTPPAESTTPAQSYPSSSPPAESTTPAQSYPSSSPPAESTTPAQSYPNSSPPAESTTPAQSYPQGTPPAGSTPAQSYPQGTPPAGSTPAQSYPQGTPPAGQTSTTWETSYSTQYETASSGGSYPSKPAPSECGTVTITVTAGQGHPQPAPTYSAMPAPPAPHHKKPHHKKPQQPQPASPVNTYSKAGPQYLETTAKPQPESNNVGKRGVGYATINSLNVGSATGIKWAHNWAASPTGLPQGIEYVPMCKDESMASEFKANAANAKYLMSFNEVDMTTGGGGSAMPPQQAASAYKEIMMPFAGTHILGAPSITSDNSPSSMLNGVSAASGLDYLKQFAEACDGCKIDFACMHWYGGAGEDGSSQAEAFKTYMEQAISTVQSLWPGAKVWVTEFSASPTIDKGGAEVNKQFMEQVLPWLDSNSDIERYSYFAAIPGNMVNPDGSLTDIGQTYASS